MILGHSEGNRLRGWEKELAHHFIRENFYESGSLVAPRQIIAFRSRHVCFLFKLPLFLVEWLQTAIARGQRTITQGILLITRRCCSHSTYGYSASTCRKVSKRFILLLYSFGGFWTYSKTLNLYLHTNGCAYDNGSQLYFLRGQMVAKMFYS